MGGLYYHGKYVITDSVSISQLTMIILLGLIWFLLSQPQIAAKFMLEVGNTTFQLLIPCFVF